MALSTFKGPVDSRAGFKINGTLITSTADEINALHSSAVSNADLVKLHAITSTAAEMSELHSSGVLSADLVKLHAVVSTAAQVDQREKNVRILLDPNGQVVYLPMPFASTVKKIYATIEGVLTTADEVITAKNNAGTGMTSGVITLVQAGSAAGNTYSVTPSANNTFTAGQNMRLDFDGGNATATTYVDICVVYSITG